MTDTTHDDTIDWNRFWTEADDDWRDTARPGREHGMADLLERFFERIVRPESFAAVGCGPADCPLALADRDPDLDVYAYDATESAVRQARESAAERELTNVTVGRATLPEFAPDRSFDVVYSYAVLHYVADVERAIRELYDAVAPGGCLIFNYPNRLTQAEWDRESKGEGVFADEERFRDRFALLLNGENVLSYDRIADVVGRYPRSFWSAADAPSYWSRADTPPEVRTGLTDACINPCVYVRKGTGR